MTDWCGRSLLKSPVRYGLCISQADFDAALDKLSADREPWLARGDEACTHFIQHDGRVRVIVCIRPNARRSLERTFGALVHEAVHVWQEIRQYIGEHAAGDEQEAYCIEQIALNLWESYKRQTV